MLAIIIGRRRQGKSTLAFALAKSQKRTVIIFDPNDQFCNVPPIRLDELDEIMEHTTPETVIRIVPTDPIPDWEHLCEILDGGNWRWGDYVLIGDECSMLMSAKLNPSLERYARTAPKDVRLILTTHRMNDTHVLFRSLATDWFIFHQYQERDLETTGDNMGSEVATATTNLPDYHVLHWWIESGGRPQWSVWDRPKDWYHDIGRRN